MNSTSFNNSINAWAIRNKLSKKNVSLLLEAYRRYHQFHKNEQLATAWLGLGYKSLYGKSAYFETFYSNTPPKKCMTWWVLTNIGITVMNDLILSLPWHDDFNSFIFNNLYEA